MRLKYLLVVFVVFEAFVIFHPFCTVVSFRWVLTICYLATEGEALLYKERLLGSTSYASIASSGGPTYIL